mgnify:CR=1 FL=1
MRRACRHTKIPLGDACVRRPGVAARRNRGSSGTRSEVTLRLGHRHPPFVGGTEFYNGTAGRSSDTYVNTMGMHWRHVGAKVMMNSNPGQFGVVCAPALLFVTD